jgi:hypothetical protein
VTHDLSAEIEACRMAGAAWREASGSGDPALHDAAALELRAAELRLDARIRSVRAGEEPEGKLDLLGRMGWTGLVERARVAALRVARSRARGGVR